MIKHSQGKLIFQRMKWQTSAVKNELEKAQKNLCWQLTLMICQNSSTSFF